MSSLLMTLLVLSRALSHGIARHVSAVLCHAARHLSFATVHQMRPHFQAPGGSMVVSHAEVEESRHRLSHLRLRHQPAQWVELAQTHVESTAFSSSSTSPRTIPLQALLQKLRRSAGFVSEIRLDFLFHRKSNPVIHSAPDRPALHKPHLPLWVYPLHDLNHPHLLPPNAAQKAQGFSSQQAPA